MRKLLLFAALFFTVGLSRVHAQNTPEQPNPFPDCADMDCGTDPDNCGKLGHQCTLEDPPEVCVNGHCIQNSPGGFISRPLKSNVPLLPRMKIAAFKPTKEEK